MMLLQPGSPRMGAAACKMAPDVLNAYGRVSHPWVSV